MTAFAALFALGATAGPPMSITMPAPMRLSDPTGDAITHHLTDAGLWRYGADLSLIRDGRKLTARVFLPEHQQSDRTHSAREATAIREALDRALRLNGFIVRFTDQFWCEKGRKGWDVIAKATANPHA